MMVPRVTRVENQRKPKRQTSAGSNSRHNPAPNPNARPQPGADIASLRCQTKHKSPAKRLQPLPNGLVIPTRDAALWIPVEILCLRRPQPLTLQMLCDSILRQLRP